MTRVLHVLDHSFPQQSGYASRSHSILSSLIEKGLDVDALTGPKHGPGTCAVEDIDGVRYWRSADNDASTSGVLGQVRTILTTRSALRGRIAEKSPAVIHAHSPCLNGIASLHLGLPLVYEMRSSWEDAAVSEAMTHEGSLRYKVSRWLETLVVNRAKAVVVICQGLRQELVNRGVPADKITVVPNALPERLFDLPDSDLVRRLKVRHGITSDKVIGYFGSFFQWEGVEDLIRAMPLIKQSVPNARLLLVGGGRQQDVLRETVAELGIEKVVLFAGRVPAVEMPVWYGVADVMVYPRLSNRLTEMVTPLKPLEAMAQQVPVVASDIGGHRELITNNRTGYLAAKGDVVDLAQKVADILTGKIDTKSAVSRAREVVERERHWSTICESYVELYDQVCGQSTEMT